MVGKYNLIQKVLGAIRKTLIMMMEIIDIYTVYIIYMYYEFD